MTTLSIFDNASSHVRRNLFSRAAQQAIHQSNRLIKQRPE
jgi:hypothetical protein